MYTYLAYLIIRYSGKFHGDSLDDLYLASGTVFNQVLYWKIKNHVSQPTGKVIKKFIGHDGVLFSVEFDGGNIITTSDDRTVRIWDMTAKDQEVKPSHTLYGHTARVWKAMRYNDKIISISEDATAKIWELSESQEYTCTKTIYGHKGKNIWSVDIQPETGMLATGGEDSSIRLWSIQAHYTCETFPETRIKYFRCLGQQILTIDYDGRINVEDKEIFTGEIYAKNTIISVLDQHPCYIAAIADYSGAITFIVAHPDGALTVCF
jgi:WD40 repeat protein